MRSIYTFITSSWPMIFFFVLYMNEREKKHSMMIKLAQPGQAASQRAYHGP